MKATTAKARRAARRRDLPLVLRAYLALLLADLGVRGLGVVPVWGRIRRRLRPPGPGGPPDGAEVARLHRAVACAARNHLYPMRCLPQSLALAWLLARRGAAVELRLGVRRHGGQFQAHAWLERDGVPLVPAPEPETPFRRLESRPARHPAGTYRGDATAADPVGEASPRMDTATLYGLCVQSDVPLPGAASAGRGPDVELVRAAPGEAPPFEPGPDSCVYRNADGPAAGNGVMEVHRRGAWYALRCTGYVDFYFTDGGRVGYVPAAGVPPEVVAALFVGPVCAVLLELRGRPCLHASAVRVGRAAVALAGNSGAGKSTLAAALVGGGAAGGRRRSAAGSPGRRVPRHPRAPADEAGRRRAGPRGGVAPGRSGRTSGPCRSAGGGASR